VDTVCVSSVGVSCLWRRTLWEKVVAFGIYDYLKLYCRTTLSDVRPQLSQWGAYRLGDHWGWCYCCNWVNNDDVRTSLPTHKHRVHIAYRMNFVRVLVRSCAACWRRLVNRRCTAEAPGNHSFIITPTN